MRQPSIRRSLLIRSGLGVGLLLCLLSAGVFLLVKESLYREVDESITQTAAMLANQVELENEKLTFEWKEGIGTNKALIEESLFQFWNEATGVTTRSRGLRQLDLPRFSAADGGPRLRTIVLPNGNRARAIGLRIYPFVLPEEVEQMKQRARVIDPKTMPHILVVARDSEPIHHTLARLRWILAGGSLLTLALGFMLIDRVVRISLRPINDLTEQMMGRTGPRLDSALDVPGELPVELSGLAENFDSLLARVAAIRERERDFIRHAAHELRTPIAGLLATTELALSKSREAKTYEGYLETCRTSASELGELVNRLSALSRVGQSSSPPAREFVNTGEILNQCIDRFSSAIRQRGLVLIENMTGTDLIAVGDPILIHIICNNLLENAVCYAPPGGEIRIHGEQFEDHVEIRISNESKDLPENVDRLFEPLFRKESSRSDSASHLGIGLTLSQEAASAMGGNLAAQTTDDGWIEFVFSMPVRQ